MEARIGSPSSNHHHAARFKQENLHISSTVLRMLESDEVRTNNEHVRLLVLASAYQPANSVSSHNKSAPAGLISPETNQRTGSL